MEKKKDIKIFVSHRIDLDSETIDNPLFVPVRCGAVFDKRENITMLGDNTGDNISEKRMSFCELTVQYWAWKNVEADYYGLCHYRRYFSFSSESYEEEQIGGNVVNCVRYPYIDKKAINKFSLYKNIMENEINKYDIITTKPIDIKKVSKGVLSNNIDCIREDVLWHNYKDFEIVRDIIEQIYPQYIEAFDEYMKSGYSYLYMCFIMKKKYFEMYSKWLFTILFELEKRMDTTHYNIQKKRSIGSITERLLGVFYLYLRKNIDLNLKIKEKQLVFFENTSKQQELYPAFEKSNIPIVLLSSNYYVPYCGVCIQSILNYITPNHNYDIIILEKNITDNNKFLLKKLVENYNNVCLRFYNADRHVYDIKFNVKSAYSIEAFYRVLTPYILKNYKKIICMDSDLVLKTDISRLYNIELSNFSIGAVKDVVFFGFINGFSKEFIKYCNSDFRMKNPYNYVNTGVMLLNLEKIRKNYNEQDIVSFMSKNDFKIQEQDGINLFFEDDIKFISSNWNTYAYSGENYDVAVQYAPVEDYNNYLEARNNPNIIHYAGRIKPWNVLEGDLVYEFWSVARNTNFYEIILYRSINEISRYHVIMNSSCDKKYKIKIKKFIKIFLPKGTKRHRFVKKLYFKLRGWPFLE